MKVNRRECLKALLAGPTAIAMGLLDPEKIAERTACESTPQDRCEPAMVEVKEWATDGPGVCHIDCHGFRKLTVRIQGVNDCKDYKLSQ